MKNRLSKIFYKTVGRFFVLHHLYVIDLKITNSKSLSKPYKLITISETDLNKLDLLIKERKDNYIDTLATRTENPKMTGLGVVDTTSDQIAYSCWIRLDALYHDVLNKEVKIKNNECFFFDAYCVSSYRGKGLHSYMMQERINHAYSLGKKKAYIGIMGFNTPALKVGKTFNYKKVKSVFRYRKGSVKCFFQLLYKNIK